MTYNEFISKFEIYDSYNKAKAEGYEAHHISVVAFQMKEYDKIHNTNYSTMRNGREVFAKEVGIPDDRCVRLTTYDHIYAHYLLALEREDAVETFYRMVNVNRFKLSDIEKITLEDLEHWATLRKQGIAKMAKSLIGHPGPNKGKKLSPETKDKIGKAGKGRTPWNKGKNDIFSDEALEKIGEGTRGKIWISDGETNKFISKDDPIPKGWKPGRDNMKGRPAWNKGKKGLPSPMKGKHHTPESRKKMSDSHTGVPLSEEHKEKMKGRTLTAEQRQHLSDVMQGHPVSEESKEKNMQYKQQCVDEYRNNNPLNLTWNEFQKYFGQKRLQATPSEN